MGVQYAAADRREAAPSALKSPRWPTARRVRTWSRSQAFALIGYGGQIKPSASSAPRPEDGRRWRASRTSGSFIALARIFRNSS